MKQSAKLSMIREAVNYLLGRALAGQIDRDQNRHSTSYRKRLVDQTIFKTSFGVLQT